MKPFSLFGVLALLASPLSAADLGGLTPFAPPVNASPVIRIWGSGPLAEVEAGWAAGFQALHPELSVVRRLDGTGLAMPGLYTGQADVALFGREPNRTDIDGFDHVLNYKPLRLEVGTGSFDRPGHSTSLVVFVHRDNPLGRLTLTQLDAIFGAERRRGAPRALRTWGDLGLAGAWAERPIRLYAFDTRSGPGAFFERTVLRESSKWQWDNFREFTDVIKPDGTIVRAGAAILAALAEDPAGLAIASLGFAVPGVRPLALAEDATSAYVVPTRATVAARAYPLARPIYVCVNRRPGGALDPKVGAWVRFVLSPDGQAALARTGVYLPLDPVAARRQQALLD